MSNTTRTSRPSARTMRSRLAKHDLAVADDATPKQVVDAYADLVASLGGAYSDPAKQAKSPKQAKQAKVATPAKPKSAPANCGCGCGQPTVTAKATFLAGHDARFAGAYGRGEITLNERQMAILADSPKLQAKVDRIIATTAKRDAAKVARAAAKAAAKAAYDQAMASV
jgi:hypothetical protein